MAHLDNRSVLQFAHVTLLGMGIEILDTMKYQGHELAIAPIAKKDGQGKHTAITVMVLKNGRPIQDKVAVESVAQQIGRMIERRHPSERGSVQQEGLTISIREDYLKAEKDKSDKLAKRKAQAARETAAEVKKNESRVKGGKGSKPPVAAPPEGINTEATTAENTNASEEAPGVAEQ